MITVLVTPAILHGGPGRASGSFSPPRVERARVAS